MSTTIAGPDGKLRCGWCAAAPEFLPYHDNEWGFPVGDDQRLFEKLSLEGFQSGLSWRTILNKRENFRAAFDGFDFNRVARFTQRDVNRLLKDVGIVRHRGKIEAVINNAKHAVDLVKREGSLAAFIWRFEPDAAQLAKPQTASTSPASIALSKDLKKLGWQFVGPTTVHAFMQAMGLINDHAEDCVIRAKARSARKRFTPPARAAGAPRSPSAPGAATRRSG
jgi:DNA-3-methyladenine glycosylase I